MKHYDISYAGKEEDYKGKGFGERHVPPRNDQHVDKILFQYSEAIAQDEEAMRRAGVEETRDGYYLKFQNTADYDFALTSLDSKSIGHIVSVNEKENAEGKVVTSAVLYLKKDSCSSRLLSSLNTENLKHPLHGQNHRCLPLQAYPHNHD